MAGKNNNRNDVEDPILANESAGRYVAQPSRAISAGALGSAPSPVLPVLVAREPGDYPVGGQFVAVASQGANTPFITVLNWSSQDGNPRKGLLTIVATQFQGSRGLGPGGPIREQVVAACLVTMGSSRGSVTFWACAPCVIPVECTYLRVDAMVSPAPYQLIQTAVGAKPTPTPLTTAHNFAGQVAANFTEDKAQGDLPSSILGASLQPCSVATGLFGLAQFAAPCIVTAIELCNANVAAGVWIGIGDAFGESAAGPHYTSLAACKGAVYVPALATVSVGASLLGTFGVGVSLFGVVSPSGALGTGWTEDTNDANVFATIYGISLQPTN